MADEIPLGKKEDLRLEFKGRDALKKLETIGREVVAMLNAEGGDVWIGLRDEEDRAVAVEAIPSPDPNRLLNYLVDTIEPSPTGHEIQVRTVAVEEGGVLRVTVRPDESRKPYAHLRESGRFFVTRVGNRIRPMGREEIASFFTASRSSRKTSLEEALGKVLVERKELQERGEKVLWLRLEPVASVAIDIQDPEVEELLQNPALTDNRRAGWNFSKFREGLVIKKDKLLAQPGQPRSAEIRKDGGLVFTVSLRALYWKGQPQEIWPYSLLEYPISAFRIARSMYQGKLAPGDPVIADLGLIGVKGWKLRPGSPGWGGYSEPEVFMESEDLVWEKPLLFTSAEINREPDRCGYRLVERVYEAFGYRRDMIPEVFDQKTGRLVFPE